MKVAIYPGSFNPLHEGHRSIISDALKIFDKVIVAVGTNPDKPDKDNKKVVKSVTDHFLHLIDGGYVEIVQFKGLLSDYVRKQNEAEDKIHAVIRGLRNAQDLEYEKTQMYWNQDLRIGIPTVCFICDRYLTHISSSAIRTVEQFKNKK